MEARRRGARGCSFYLYYVLHLKKPVSDGIKAPICERFLRGTCGAVAPTISALIPKDDRESNAGDHVPILVILDITIIFLAALLLLHNAQPLSEIVISLPLSLSLSRLLCSRHFLLIRFINSNGFPHKRYKVDSRAEWKIKR